MCVLDKLSKQDFLCVKSPLNINRSVKLYFSIHVASKYESLEPHSKFKIHTLKYAIWNSKYVFGILNRVFGIPNSIFEIFNLDGGSRL